MIDGRNFYGQPVKRWFKNIWQEHSKRFKNIQKLQLFKVIIAELVVY